MIPTNSEIKIRARESLLGNYGPVVAAVLLAEVIGWFCGVMFTFSVRSVLAFLLSCAISTVLSIVFHVLHGGFDYMYLQLARDRKIKMTDIFHCIMTDTDVCLKLAALLFVVNLAAALPLILLDLFLLPAFSTAAAGRWVSLWVELILWLVYMIAAAAVNLIYSMSFLLLIDDPSLTPIQAMRTSRSLTMSCFSQLLLLFLSFAGYFLLGIISFGLGFLWVYPYIGTAKAHFYLCLREAQKTAEKDENEAVNTVEENKTENAVEQSEVENEA